MRHCDYHDFVNEVVLVFVVLSFFQVFSLSLPFVINVVECCRRRCSFYWRSSFYSVVCSSLFSASLCPRMAFLL